jgi:hypothetical protein
LLNLDCFAALNASSATRLQRQLGNNVANTTKVTDPFPHMCLEPNANQAQGKLLIWFTFGPSPAAGIAGEGSPFAMSGYPN